MMSFFAAPRLVLLAMLFVASGATAQSSFERVFEGVAADFLNNAIRQQQQSQRPVQTRPQASQPVVRTVPRSQAQVTAPRSYARSDVMEAQRNLNALGYDAGPVDGLYGSRTRAALIAFQRNHGLSPDGAIGAASLEALRAELTAAPPAASGPSFDCTRASKPSEFAICGTPSLAELDRRIAEQFTSISGAAPGEADRLRAEQRAWLTARDGCGADIACLDRTMSGRIAVLAGTAGDAVPVAVTAPPPPATVPLADPAAIAPDPAQAVEPDYRLLYRLRLNSISDLAFDAVSSGKDLLALEHYLLFAFQGEEGRQQCREEQIDDALLYNEIARRSITAEAHAFLHKRLPQIEALPDTTRVALARDITFGEYDMERRSFPLSVPAFDVSLGRPHVLECGDSLMYLSNRGVSGQEMGALGIAAPPMPETLELPMDVEAAEDMLGSVRRDLRLEAVLEIGPEWQGTSIESRLASARVVDPETGEVLHEFDTATFGAAREAVAASATKDDSGRFTRVELSLAMLRAQPDLLSGSALEELARLQIQAEQGLHEQVDRRRAQLASGGGLGNLDPRRPVVVTSWQELSALDLDLAAQAAAGIYATEPPDWSALHSAEGLDPRFDYELHFPVFAREAVEGRAAEFAAVELGPVLRDALLSAAERLPERKHISFGKRLHSLRYDVAAEQIVAQDGRPIVILSDLRGATFGDPSNAGNTGSAGYMLPAELEDRVILAFFDTSLDESTRSGGPGSAHDNLRYRLGHSYTLHPAAIALGHRLELDAIPLPRAQAEAKLGSAQAGNVVAEVVLEIEAVREVRQLGSGSGRGRRPVISGQLVEVRFTTPDGTPLTTLTADEFPSIAALHAEAAAEAAAARAEEEAAATEAASAADRLASLFGDNEGTHLLTLAGTERIDTVLNYSHNPTQYVVHVRDRSLDLPPQAENATVEEAAKRLADEPGVAVLVSASSFENRLLDLTRELDLRATPFPPEDKPKAGPEDWPAGWRVPADSNLLIVEVGESAENSPILVDASVGMAGWSIGLREPRVHYYLDELGVEIEYEFTDEIEAEALTVRDLADRLGSAGGRALVNGETLAKLAGPLSDVPVEIRRFPTEDFHVGIPKDHQEGPDAFAVLGISAGMNVAEVRQAAAESFAAEEMSGDDRRFRAARGRCADPLVVASASAEDAGSLCLQVDFAGGTAQTVRLHQVLPGRVEEPAIEALKERFGRSIFLTEMRELPGGDRLYIFGWGAVLDADRATLGRVDGELPPSVTEAVLWVTDVATTIDVQLDAVRTAAEAEAAALPEIKL